ncbi:MAG: M20/M25/M40 family metallo-hydrolase [Candidatus Acidiferrales bacterium]
MIQNVFAFRISKTLKIISFSCILLEMVTLSARALDSPVDVLAQDSHVVRAVEWFTKNSAWITDQQVRITEIPAPEFSEKARGEFVRKLLDAGTWKLSTDAAGNIVAERPGADQDVVLLVAHLDTVFPASTDVHVKKNGSRLEAPGISDNGAGLAALVALARAIDDAGIKTGMTLVFSADVGEEGEGNLRGIRRLVETYRSRLRAVIALDGFSAEHVTSQALASRRVEVTVTGPGGHSWSDFGTPNPITALARAIVHFSAIRLPDSPRSSYNFGVIEGGSSVNSIPASATLKVDMRSEDESKLAQLEAEFQDSVKTGMQEETAASDPDEGTLDVKYRVLGIRPGGKLDEQSSLFAAFSSVDKYLGIRTRLERASTDANIPLSLGIPAISIGGGGQGGGAHTLGEWYDPSGREIGLRRALLMLLAVAGLQS